MLNYIASMAPNVRRLNFQRCLGLTDSGFTIFSGGLTDTLMQYNKLTELLLNDCSFLSDSAIEDISMSCPNLRILNVSFCCAITDVSWTYLVEGCVHLSVLDASFCGPAVTDESLLLMSTQFKLLHALSVRGCPRVTHVGIGYLAANAIGLHKLNISACKGIDQEMLPRKTKWQVLEAQAPVIANTGISGSTEDLGSTHIRRATVS